MNTKQEIFDLVWKRANEMEVPAVNENDRCMYRSPNGPCLIGSLIKDEFYDPEIEGKGAGNSVVVSVLEKSGIEIITDSNCRLLDQLQYSHDNCKYNGDEFKSSMLYELRKVADVYGLTVPSEGEVK